MARRRTETSSSLGAGMLAGQGGAAGFQTYASEQAWSPPINIYQVGRSLQVCVDLAGIDRKQLDVRIEPGKLTIQGTREAPKPRCEGRGATTVRILTMEIDNGNFCRTIGLPPGVKLDEVSSTYRDGLLWITLPLSGARR